MPYPNTQTLAQLILAAKQHADLVNSLFLSDAEWTANLNASYFELFDVLISTVEHYGMSTIPYSFTTNSTSQFYDLPSDFYKLNGVDWQLSSQGPQQRITLRRFNWGERNRFNGFVPPFAYGLPTIQYDIVGNKIALAPFPQSGQNVIVWYTPRLLPLTDPGTITFVDAEPGDTVTINGSSFVGVAASPTGFQFLAGGPTGTAKTATSLSGAINASYLSSAISTTDSAGVVTFTQLTTDAVTWSTTAAVTGGIVLSPNQSSWTTIADGVSGWLEYVIVDAAIKAKQKEESDCSVLLMQKAALLKRIEAMAQTRDQGAPPTVTETAGMNGGEWGWGGGYGGGG